MNLNRGMDDDARKRRQNDPNQYPASDTRYSQDHGQGRSFASSSTDRFRAQPPISASPSVGRGIAGSASSYGYYTEATPTYSTSLPGNNMQYQAEYGPDQRQQQTFSSYTPSMMYGVNQQAPQSTVYDTTPHFQRQPAGMQLLSEVAAPYFTGETGNSAGTSLIQQQGSSSSTTAFQQSPVDRTSLLQSYSSGMGGMGGMVPGSAEAMEDEEYGPSGLDEAYNSYQTALKEIFLNIRNGMLVDASSSLLRVSEWLLSHVGELGLTADDESLHGDRIKMWNEFNNAWLATLQKQKDLTVEYIQNGNVLRHSQSLVPLDFLEKMGKELLRLCDNIDKHGLVDYQYGVAESYIIDILTECEALLKDADQGGSGGAALP